MTTEQATKHAYRFRIDERSPGHTTFTVFVGQEGQGGNAGKLTLRNEEYDVLAPLLLSAPRMLRALEALTKACANVTDVGPAYDDALRAIAEAQS